MTHFLITGLPGVGKTTLIRTMAERLTDQRPAGFYTEEMRASGGRVGFRLVTLDGRTQVLAHVDRRGSPRIGRYGVDVEGFERILRELDLPHAPGRLIIIDEIGKMECLSKTFVADVNALLNSQKIVLATVGLKGTGYIEEIKRRPGCRLITMTRQNRTQLVDVLVHDVREALHT
ncbi:NTPase [Candidatus Nitrospira bockiana]